MKGKIMIMALAVALLVGFATPSSARADEVQEWTNFAEWCGYNGVDMSTLPFGYSDEYGYIYYVSSNTRYLFVFDKSLTKPSPVGGGSTSIKLDATDFYLVYKSSDGGVTWTGSSSTSIELKHASIKYTDMTLYYPGFFAVTGVTLTGNYTQWDYAVSKLKPSQKSKIAEYPYYIVQVNPVRINDWRSEQFMILCAKTPDAIIRDESYNAICFTTGTGKLSGSVYIYDSFSEKWYTFDSSYAYSLGSTVQVGNVTPSILYSNVDIYYEQGITYAKDAEVWRSAVPYDSSVTPTPVPPQKQEVVTTGFPRLFDVIDSVGFVRQRADLDSIAVLALGKGKGGYVYGVEYDNSGDAWYNVKVLSNGTEYEGYILADSVYVGYSVPSVGGGDSGGSTGGSSVTPAPTVAPPIASGQATITKNRTAIYEEPSATSQVQHYVFEGGVVYIVEEHGDDWYYVRYDMGGISYTGYVAKENVDYDAENGFASESVLDGYEGQVDDLLGMVGNVPKMIMVLFSFLPPWCLALVGVSFTAMLALIGWKLLRG